MLITETTDCIYMYLSADIQLMALVYAGIVTAKIFVELSEY